MLGVEQSKVILVDGPLAGHQIEASPFSHALQVVDPYALHAALRAAPAAIPTLSDPFADVVTYRIERGEYRPPARPVPAVYTRIGWCGGGSQPSEEALKENVPTGLAALGLIPWGEVPVTDLDLISPLHTYRLFDPRIPCELDVSDPYRLGGGPNTASCACGWTIDEDLPLERRAQVLRAAHRHRLEETVRRHLFDRPIYVTDYGIGHGPDCHAQVRVDGQATAGSAQGACAACGWRTESVAGFRYLALIERCNDHTAGLDPLTAPLTARFEVESLVPDAWGEAWAELFGHALGAGLHAHVLAMTSDGTTSATGVPFDAGGYGGENDWPEQGGTCAHVCGPDPDHRCAARATTRLTYKLPSGGRRRMPICEPCHESETRTAKGPTEDTDDAGTQDGAAHEHEAREEGHTCSAS